MFVILAVVLLVMTVMNAALFFVLRTAADVTEKQVRSCFVKELENYNEYIDVKKAESDQLREEKRELKKEISNLDGVLVSLKTSPFYAPRPLARELFVPTARYVDNEFFDSHKIVKEKMANVDFGQVVRDIRDKYEYHGNRQEYDTACNLLDFLNMDTLYELCTVSAEVQLEILRDCLEGEEAKMLARYVEELDGEFDVLRFRAHLREIKSMQDPDIYIRTGEEQFDNKGDASVVHQYDRNISEGLRVVWQNQYFDYSIYRSRSKK